MIERQTLYERPDRSRQSGGVDRGPGASSCGRCELRGSARAVESSVRARRPPRPDRGPRPGGAGRRPRLRRRRPTPRPRSTSVRGSRRASIASRKQPRCSMTHSPPDIQLARSMSNGRRCSRRREGSGGAGPSPGTGDRKIAGSTRSARSRRCWRRWINGRRPRASTRRRSTRIRASRPCRAANCSSNGA